MKTLLKKNLVKIVHGILMASSFVGLNLLIISESLAVPNTKQAQLLINEYIAKGSFSGGQAGNGFSLKEVKRVVSYSKN